MLKKEQEKWREKLIQKSKVIGLGVVAHTFNPSLQEAETGESAWSIEQVPG